MALPDRLPEPPDDFETHSASERPSWLVGAEEGAASEIEGIERSQVKLVRPSLPESQRAASPATAPAPTPAAPPKPVAWTAAGNSVPRLTQVPEPARRAPEPPVEDLDPVADPLSDPEPTGMLTPSVARSMPSRITTLEEPWWLILGERIGSDRRIQIGIGAVIVLALALLFWPHGNRGISVRELRKNPDKWEGQTVSVSGRVGDVFPLGSGYVFNLQQGRDTIVVFTRGGQPEPRSHVQVTGEVSAGYLDGRARLAILETPQAGSPPPTP